MALWQVAIRFVSLCLSGHTSFITHADPHQVIIQIILIWSCFFQAKWMWKQPIFSSAVSFCFCGSAEMTFKLVSCLWFLSQSRKDKYHTALPLWWRDFGKLWFEPWWVVRKCDHQIVVQTSERRTLLRVLWYFFYRNIWHTTQYIIKT